MSVIDPIVLCKRGSAHFMQRTSAKLAVRSRWARARPRRVDRGLRGMLAGRSPGAEASARKHREGFKALVKSARASREQHAFMPDEREGGRRGRKRGQEAEEKAGAGDCRGLVSLAQRTEEEGRSPSQARRAGCAARAVSEVRAEVSSCAMPAHLQRAALLPKQHLQRRWRPRASVVRQRGA